MTTQIGFNVTIEARDAGGSIVRIADPQVMLSIGRLGKNSELAAVAQEARHHLERVAQALK